jgi:hypothetical protein
MDADTPFHLTMRGDDMETYTSPNFDLLGKSFYLRRIIACVFDELPFYPPSSLASPAGSVPTSPAVKAAEVNATPEPLPEPSSSSIFESDAESHASATAVSTLQPTALEDDDVATSAIDGEVLSTASPIPSLSPTRQPKPLETVPPSDPLPTQPLSNSINSPPAPTIPSTSPSVVIVPLGQASSAASAKAISALSSTSKASAPNVKAIAIPLACLFLIALGALIFCLRKKPDDGKKPMAAIVPDSVPTNPYALGPDLEKGLAGLHQQHNEKMVMAMSPAGSIIKEFGVVSGRSSSPSPGFVAIPTLSKLPPARHIPSRNRRESYDPEEDPYTRSPPRSRRFSGRTSLTPDCPRPAVYRSHSISRSTTNGSSYTSRSTSSQSGNIPPPRRHSHHLDVVPSPSQSSHYSPSRDRTRSSRHHHHRDDTYVTRSSSSSSCAASPFRDPRTPAYLPSHAGSPIGSELDLGFNSFPWKDTPYTPSLSPPYLPTLRGVSGRPGMGVDRSRSGRSEMRDDDERESRGRGSGSRSGYDREERQGSRNGDGKTQRERERELDRLETMSSKGSEASYDSLYEQLQGSLRGRK